MLDVTDLVQVAEVASAQQAGQDPISRRWLVHRESVLRGELSGQAAKIFAEADADHSGELDFEVKRAYVVKCSKDFNCPSIAV